MKPSYYSYTNEVYDSICWVLKTHRLHGVKKDLSQKALRLINDLPEAKNLIKISTVFRLPDNGLLFNSYDDSNKKRLNSFVSEINLPFSVCTLEFDLSKVLDGTSLDNAETYKYCVTLVDNVDHISVFDMIDDGNKDGWTFLSFDALRLDKKTFEFYDNEESYGFGMPEVLNREKAIVDFICAMSCNNVEVIDSEIKPSTVKQTIRKQKGKIPLFTHKILSINGKKALSANGGGTHASPSQHLRRGHIRRLPNKNVWVNACVVGKKDDGVVVKGYAMN